MMDAQPIPLEVYEREQSAAKPAGNFTLYRDIEAMPRKDWLVRDFLGDAELSCAFGAPGTSKSAITIDLSAHIAAGREWFGRRVMQGPVLYVALERAAVVKRRLAAWRKHHGIDDIPLAVLAGQYDLRSSTAGADEIIRAANHLAKLTGSPVRFIPIETVNRALAGGDENSPKDMGALVNNLTRIQDATGAHVLVTHHIPADGSQRLRGHGALLGAVDITFRIEKAGSLYTATVDKSNDGPDGERLAYALTSVDLHYDSETDITTTAPVIVPHDGDVPKAGGDKPLTKNQQTMFAILFDAGARGLTVDDWNNRAREAGIGTSRKADLYDIRKALLGKGMVCEGNIGWFARRDN
jgi:hypothetical protein